MKKRSVRALYGVHSICQTVTRFRIRFARVCSLSLGRKVLLYALLGAPGLASDRVTRTLNLSTSGASGIVHSIRKGGLVAHLVNGRSGHRVHFSLAARNGGQVSSVGGTAFRLSRLLRRMIDLM